MSRFLSESAPPELLIEILSLSSTLNDVLSFALTCRHMWHAWETRHAGLRVAWKLFDRDVPAAELALVTARASRLVSDAQRIGQLQSASITLPELESRHRLPDAAELQAVQRLHTLATALETRFARSEYSVPAAPGDLIIGHVDTPEPAEQMDAWKQGMHRAIYRSFIASASLAGVYLEPTFKAAASSDPEIQQLGRTDELSEAQLNFLCQFAAYQPQATIEQDHEAFGNFGDWLLGNILSDTALRSDMEQKFALCVGRALGCDERRRYHRNVENDERWGPQACPVRLAEGHSHADAHMVALELIRMLWVCGNIAEREPFDLAELRSSPLAGSCGPIVPWDMFGSRTITFTAPSRNLKLLFEPELYITIFPGIKEEPADTRRLVRQAERDYWELEQLKREGIYMPPLELKFFVYFLQRHLRVAFEPMFFQPDEGREIKDNFQVFKQDLRIFALDESEDRVPYYPNGASEKYFESADFLDGTDLLVAWGPLQARIASFLEGEN